MTQTNVDKDEMEDVVDGEENVDHEEEVVRNDDDKEEEEVDVLDVQDLVQIFSCFKRPFSWY